MRSVLAAALVLLCAQHLLAGPIKLPSQQWTTGLQAITAIEVSQLLSAVALALQEEKEIHPTVGDVAATARKASGSSCFACLLAGVVVDKLLCARARRVSLRCMVQAGKGLGLDEAAQRLDLVGSNSIPYKATSWPRLFVDESFRP